MDNLTDLVAAQNAPGSNYRQMAIEQLQSQGKPITGDALQMAIMQLVGSQPQQVPISQTVATQAGEVVPSPSPVQQQPPPAPMQKPSPEAATASAQPSPLTAEDQAYAAKAAKPYDDAMLYALLNAQGAPATRSEVTGPSVPPTVAAAPATPTDQAGFGAKEAGALALLTAILAGGSPAGRRMATQLGSKMLPDTRMPMSAADMAPAMTLRNPAPTSTPTRSSQGRPMVADDINVNPQDAAIDRLQREFIQGKPAIEGPGLRATKLQEAMKARNAQRRGGSQREVSRPQRYEG